MPKSADNRSVDNIRHSLAHLLAAAVLQRFPKAKLGIGPIIENGFYYDFAVPRGFTPDDLKEFEKIIKRLIKDGLPFKGKKITPSEGRKIFSAGGGSAFGGNDQPFKLELIQDFVKEKKQLTAYRTGDVFIDLCKGGHVKNTKEINPDAFKLISTAGAYWKGSEKNPQLQRIYGVAFKTKKELDAYIAQVEEAERRDHKKLGAELELFMFHHTSPGMPYWLPKGVILYNELVNFWRDEHSKRGYQEIVSPILNKKELYETSGHYDHYWPEMFVADMGENELYGVKAMNCPNAMVVFGSKSRSYRELPLRLSDTDALHRYERSGVLNGLFRVREFRQDDAHIFVSEDQIESEYEAVFEIVKRFYSIFGMKYEYRLGTRPEGFLGDIKTWNVAEKKLKAILKRSGKKFTILEGDGAFYGPKVDILMKDAIGREWQMGTIQLDFNQPRRFELKYTAKDGKERTPVIIHRVIYGSLERFIGILIEHYAGAFPTWLSPVQAQILPVSRKHEAASKKVFKTLQDSGIRALLTDSNETIGKRIREGEIGKVPYLLVVGDKEIKSNSVAVRKRGRKEIQTKKLKSFLEEIKREIDTRS